MATNPREYVKDPLVLDLVSRLEETTSPHEYMSTFSQFHKQMVAEGVKTASPQTITDLCTLELYTGTKMDPNDLVKRYKEYWPHSPDPEQLIAMPAVSDQRNLAISPFHEKIDAMWKQTGPIRFMAAFSEYHFHMWREGFADTPLPSVLALVQFEQALGFPLDNEDIVNAYKTAQYGFVEHTIAANPTLNKNFAKDLSCPSLDTGKRTKRGAITITPDWENLWGEDKEQNDVPIYWSFHRFGEDKWNRSAIYLGATLMRAGKVRYYDRYPMAEGRSRSKTSKTRMSGTAQN